MIKASLASWDCTYDFHAAKKMHINTKVCIGAAYIVLDMETSWSYGWAQFANFEALTYACVQVHIITCANVYKMHPN